MPKINHEEYEILKELDEPWKWIARDEDRGLYAFTEKPVRKYDPSPYWDTETEEDYSALELFDEIHLLQFIQWEDEEPYNIAELIKEYEEEPDLKEQMSVVMDRLEEVCGIAMKEVGRVFGGIGLESEEAEVKNKEWAIKEIEGLETESSQYYPHDEMIETEIVFSILDQLDEPEVLSHKWVSDNTVVGQYPNGMGYVVPTYKLQNLLVPEQELPVIPKFVGKWIEEMKQDERPLYSAMSSLMNKTNHEWAVWKSANKNFSEIVAQAWLNGFTVEKEQKYRVIFPSVDKNGKGFNYLAKDCYHKELWVEDARTDGLDWEERSSFTEDEIRDLDRGDILFEHFAVKVEELEE